MAEGGIQPKQRRRPEPVKPGTPYGQAKRSTPLSSTHTLVHDGFLTGSQYLVQVLDNRLHVPQSCQPRGMPAEKAQRIRFAGRCLDTAARHLLTPDGLAIPLSGAEYRLVIVFLSPPNRVLNRDQLMDMCLGRKGTPFDRSIDAQVSRLRRRMREDAREPAIIETARGEGYVLSARVEQEA